MRTRPRPVALLGMAALAAVGLGNPLHSAPRDQSPGASQPSCDGTRSTITFSVSSSRTLGRSWTALPEGARAIKVVVTVPANQSRDAKDCDPGDERVAVGTCPAKGGPDKQDCVGIAFDADSGTGLTKCHDVDQSLGPYDWRIPEWDEVKLDFNAITASRATANIEINCKP